ncbi:zinc finger protein 260 isoform X2 [Anabrus simplex]|uniref:zinc finger protein 260 isoform X2 n=2 Tax=Anabrus simplex TaxID=316456 RepID=UPI0035A28A64
MCHSICGRQLITTQDMSSSLLNEVSDIHKCCRLCLSNGEGSIFDYEPSKEIPFVAKIMVCVSLPISPSDNLPKFICFKCTKLVNDFFTFRETCWNSHMHMMQFRKSMEKHSEVFDPSSTVNLKEAEVQGQFSVNDCSNSKQKTGDETVCLEPARTSLKAEEKFLNDNDDKSVIEQEPHYDLEIVEDHDYNFPFARKDHFAGSVSFEEERSPVKKEKENDKSVEHVPVTLSDKIKMPSIAVSGVGHLKCYKCSDCVKVFPSIKALNKHINICPNSLNHLNTSVSQEEDSEDFESILDSEKCKLDSEDVDSRSRWGEKRSYLCPTCGKVFKTTAVLKNHIKIHTGERPFLCSLCSRSFRQLGALRNHEMKHSGTSTHPCKICGKGFFRPSDLEKHVRSHTGERPYMCSVCSKTFHQLSGLLVHERIHTGERPYACAFCPATFNQWANKQRHEKTHAGGTKPFTCAVCHRKYSDRKEMELHQAVHGGGRPRLCHFCKKGFRKPSELRDHLRRFHTNERPYECKICSKRFCASHEVKQHLLVHTGERPFKCTICPRAFSQKGNLRRHQLRHHDGSPPREENNEQQSP